MNDTNKRDFVTPSVRLAPGILTIVIMLLAAVTGGKMTAWAQTPEASQTRPLNTVEVGAGYVSASSFKFSEYNGLQNQTALNFGRFDLRGGATFDSGSAWRWRIQGTNPGLETRNFLAEFGSQGKFRFQFGYEEILANRSDTNQTMYLGAGTNELTLPTNWLKPVVPQINSNINFRSFDPIAGTGSVYNSAGVLTAPTAAQLALLASIRATDVPDFHNVDLATKRTRIDAGFSYSPTDDVDIPVSFREEHKSGRKALGAVSSQVNENAVILPDPIDSDTEQANVIVNYRRKQLVLTGSYYGSFFNNNIKSMSWQDVADPRKYTTMATEPSNQSNQLSLTAGYKMSAKVKLVATGSYGRNTQNQAYLDPMTTASDGATTFALPVGSLNGLVVTSGVNVKLTAKATKKLNFTAAYKFDDRDNQTPIHTYLFQDANEAKSGVSPFAGLYGLPANLGSNTNIYSNRAYSKQTNQVNLQTEYALTKKQYVEAGYDWQRLDRSCTDSWINCADAPTTNENTVRGEWHTSKVGNINAKVGYAYAWRRGKYDENAFLALVPMANFIPAGTATTSVWGYLQQTGLTAFGPVAGEPTTPNTGNAGIFSPDNNIVPQRYYGSRNNINEIPGLRRYMVADCNRHKVRSDLEWQATEKFSLQGTGEFNNDDYLNSTYGLRKGTFWQATADLSYTASENAVIDLYYTRDNQRFVTAGDAYANNSTATFQGQTGNTVVDGSCFTTVADKNLNGKIDPCLKWSKDNRDSIDTIGFTIRRKNLVRGKLELADEIMFTRARTTTAVSGGSYVNNPLALSAAGGAPPLPAGTAAVFLIAASDYPMVRNDEIMVRPSFTYALSNALSFRGSYMFQRLMPTDWAYLGLQLGTGTNYLPTAEKTPSYAVHFAALSLVYTFASPKER